MQYKLFLANDKDYDDDDDDEDDDNGDDDDDDTDQSNNNNRGRSTGSVLNRCLHLLVDFDRACCSQTLI